MSDDSHVETKVVLDPKTGEERTLSYELFQVIGSGSFGIVMKAKIVGSQQYIAVKRVFQDKRYKNRELQIMRAISHQNIVNLIAFFHTHNPTNDETHLSLLLEYSPETVFEDMRWYTRRHKSLSTLSIKIYAFQIFRALSYLHSTGICHRDIKPQNLLVDYRTGVLKLCDFGSAKILIPSEPNVSYICSRYYRAPELVFGATHYTTKIDVWSAGCVIAELILGRPLFPGDSSVEQLVEIIKVLGTPTQQEITSMNPNYVHHALPNVRPHFLESILPKHVPKNVLDLLKSILVYVPSKRISAIEVLTHPFFDELRDPNVKYSVERDSDVHDLPLPPLFNFSLEELSIRPNLNKSILPPHEYENLDVDINNFKPMLVKQANLDV
ncbi:serine/threonine protein kinase Gsk31 [Schizosaccharomyces osmophilus]|uniref:Serine/threonine protein kinase Gsk31 n=1 Tax=Schizosaccharomyces osmophilus TaxID=2545709 RepID=A0AAE9WD30_9SCHI|nr:serine/threonine protein kinase Gsk31 [Schizosaccharomyces osmophilus]WBW72942.1 serine/threonine protein kinase Gsk31 [Schizosaccharomyces osmophilus]